MPGQSDLYTDGDVAAATTAITVARGLNPDVVNAYRDAAQSDWARAVLDAVAPAIAARALREAAHARGERGYYGDALTRTWLRARADEIDPTPQTSPGVASPSDPTPGDPHTSTC